MTVYWEERVPCSGRRASHSVRRGRRHGLLRARWWHMGNSTVGDEMSDGFPTRQEVERRRTAGFPREHLVIAWKRVDFPTLARPTCNGVKVSENLPHRYFMHNARHGGLKKKPTIPLFKLFPGLPSIIFSSLAAFFGGIFLTFAYDLVKSSNTVVFRLRCTNGVGGAKR